MEKPYFIRKNKLVRTTTFTATLLIATILLISSVVPAAIQVNNNNEIITKNNDMQQIPEQAIDLKTADRTISIYPSKMTKIESGGNDNFMDLWDNGLPDGINGVSCGQFSGLNREIVDDFPVDAPWMVSGAEMRFVTYYGYGPEAISGVTVMFFNDAGGVPETTAFATVTATYSGILTGNYYFSRPEVLETLSFDTVILNPGTYWVDIQPISTDNIFWLTSAGYGSEIYLSYPDMGYPRWTAGHIVFGSYYYGVSFKLTGTLSGLEHDVSVNSIDAPVSGAAGESFIPKIKVGNNGNQTENDVPIEMTIGYYVPALPDTCYMVEPFNTWMPAGWTQDGSWVQYYSNYAGGTYPEACLPWNNVYYGAYLMSPAVNTMAATTLQLSFRSFIDWYYDAGIYCKVWVQSGIGDWSDVTPWANPVTGNVGPGLYDIDITTKKGTGTQVMFEFSGTGWMLDYWYIDDVRFCQPGTPAYYQTEYDEILLVDIPKNGLLDVIFPAWEPQGWQTAQNQDINYQINAWTDLIGDEIPSNNLKTKNIALSYPFFHDIAVISINDPTEDGPAKTLPVGATIKNVGQYEECCYQTGVTIGQQQVVATLLSEEFTYGCPPAGWTDEHKYVAYYYGWSLSYSQQSQGASPEAMLPYYYALAGYKLYSYAFDTSTYPGAVLEFKSYINHYYGQGLYTLKAAASTNNGATWTEVWSYAPSASGQFDVSVPIPAGSATTRIALYFEGDPWYFNYWYVDNVVVKAVQMVPEYTDLFCTIELAPGESMDLEFDDWTPAGLALGVSGEIDYIVMAEQQLPTDTNPANDAMSDGFTLDYWHDVKVKSITSPANDRGEVIFAQRPYTSTESWSFYTTALTSGYECMDDFWDLTSPIGDIEFWGVCLIYAYGWTPGNQNALEFEVKFYEDNGGVPGNLVTTMELPASTPELYDTFSGYPGYHWVYDLPESVALANGWLSIQSKAAADNAWLLWSGGPEGNFNALQNGGGLGDNLAFNLSSGGPGPGQVKVWVALGATEDISGVLQNAGVFDELDLTCYADMYEFITDPENATLVYSANIPNVDLDVPLGGEETVIFDPFTFTMQGVYSLELSIPAAIDDFPANNIMKVGIGVDDSKPASTHALNPATPNGLNGWYVSDLTVTLDATDGEENWQAGVKEIVYKVNGVQKTIAGGHGSFKIEDDGENIAVEYYAVDKVGNEEAPHHTFTVDMDQTKPTISLVYEVTGGNPITGYEITFTATSTDETSGMERVDYYLNSLFEITVTGSGPTYQWIVELGNVPHVIIRAIGYDMAGNNDYDEIEDPVSHSNEQSLPQSATQTTIKINLGR